MGMCPICNGLDQLKLTCDVCQSELIDYGRMIDYIGKYSAYMEIDPMKESNGIDHDLRDGQCAHYLTCDRCQKTSVYLINEQ